MSLRASTGVNMQFLSYIYRNGRWISVPLFVISAALLVCFMLNMIRVVRQAYLLSVLLLAVLKPAEVLSEMCAEAS